MQFRVTQLFFTFFQLNKLKKINFCNDLSKDFTKIKCYIFNKLMQLLIMREIDKVTSTRECESDAFSFKNFLLSFLNVLESSIITKLIFLKLCIKPLCSKL